MKERKCDHKRCAETHSVHVWSNIRAQDDGWFFTKAGEAYCPRHHPDWVAAWREKMKKGMSNG